MVAGRNGNTLNLIARGGVHPALGNMLQVTQAGTPAMSVVVKSGLGSVPGTLGAKQGTYFVLNDNDVTLTISAAHASLNRIDSVVFKVEDQAYSGSVNTSSLVVVTGTPAASPSPPTLPDNALELAQVSVVANDTSITNGEITDKRKYLTAVGGIIPCTSTTRPAASTVATGQVIFETDNSKLQVTLDNGSTWVEIWASAWRTYTPALSAAGTAPSLGNGTVTGRYIQYGKTVHCFIKLVLGSTTSMGTSQFYLSLPVNANSNAVWTPGSGRVFDTGTANRSATCFIFSTLDKVAGIVGSQDITNLQPQTFATGDEIEYQITYEAA